MGNTFKGNKKNKTDLTEVNYIIHIQFGSIDSFLLLGRDRVLVEEYQLYERSDQEMASGILGRLSVGRIGQEEIHGRVQRVLSSGQGGEVCRRGVQTVRLGSLGQD